MKKLIKNFLIVCLGLVLAIGFFILTTRANQFDSQFHIYFLNVGQGDAALIRTPDNHKILIDAGPDQKTLEELSRVLGYFDRQIDLVIISHPHADHLGGLSALKNFYQINKIALTQEASANSAFKTLEFDENKILLVALGDNFCLSEVCLNVLWPEKISADENLNSLVLDAVYKDHHFLFTGDINTDAEDAMINEGKIKKADILKVPHHGSATSLDQAFLDAVSPKDAVISVGENTYGHPNDKTLELLSANKTPIYRTETMGTIECGFMGEEVSCKGTKQ